MREGYGWAINEEGKPGKGAKLAITCLRNNYHPQFVGIKENKKLVLVNKVCCSIWAVNFFVFSYSTISFTAHV
jgi:hypothetical protein